MIGTPDAIEAGSYETQAKNWASNLCMCASASVGNGIKQSVKLDPESMVFCASGLNLFLCPAAMNANNMYRLYSLAHVRLGYTNYSRA
jgi:hypothetical protein